MQTKLVLISSAILMGLTGIFLIFAPDIALQHVQIVQSKNSLMLIQILGALYFGFSLLNWMVRFNVIGGIYNRPIALANFIHFFVVGMAMIKEIISTPFEVSLFFISGLLYFLFAMLFGIISFTHPKSEQ